ncbi:MAG: Cu(I)-responsive transcriptional regulator [Gammaproteobacteria bacterium]|nr:Cu(I)-responsive transcriptional regulator [Gammaproteobacteria bacterium]
MNIGEAARASGVSAKMIRHYEYIDLIPRAGRTASGYRVYSGTDLYMLSFIRQARNLGFSIERIRDLLDLWQNKRRTSQKVKALAMNHLRELDERILELQEIRQAIAHLADYCHGDERPDCPILDGLAAENGHILNGAKSVPNSRHLAGKKQG